MTVVFRTALASIFTVFVVLTLAFQLAASEGMLSKNLRIESKALGYALQYRVYIPPDYKDLSNLPTIYITDGQWYLENGHMHKVLDTQIKRGNIKPVIAVFVDNRNPDKLQINRRNFQFMCVTEYAEFFRSELIPTISRDFKVSTQRTDRVILGVSFGGLNSGCFGIMANDVFEGIAMQSPAMHPVPSLQKAYELEARRPIKVYLSAGDEGEITRRTLKLKRTLEKKGYPVLLKRSKEGHNWRNWRPHLDDILIYYFKK